MHVQTPVIDVEDGENEIAPGGVPTGSDTHPRATGEIPVVQFAHAFAVLADMLSEVRPSRVLCRRLQICSSAMRRFMDPTNTELRARPLSNLCSSDDLPTPSSPMIST